MNKRGVSATDILDREFGSDPAYGTGPAEERSKLQAARAIYDARVAAGLTQLELAQRVGTTQSVIARLEDADYEGHSLAMLHRIANALGQRLTIGMSPREPERRRA